MKYLEYTAENFAAEESFQNYYLYEKKEEILFWERWISENPSKIVEITAAKKLLDTISIRPNSKEIADSYQALKYKIDQTSKGNIVGLNRRGWLRIAGVAAAILAIFSSGYFLLQTPEPVWMNHQTAFGENQSIYLPDSSLVVLNGNSKIKFDQSWSKNETRTVWLEGEAFFDVRKKPVQGGQAFVVHAKDAQVNVLGTSFNVYNRKKRVEVVLASGKVDFLYQKGGKQLRHPMSPNDLVALDAQQNLTTQSNINTRLFTAWKEKQLILDKTPLRKVVDILEDNFGFEVVVKDQESLNRKLTATIPVVDIDILLDALTEIYGFKIKKEGQRIWINN